MKLTDQVHLVGSGRLGFELSNPFDCHVFLLDGGSEAALIDAGVGLDVDLILENIRATGLEKKVTKIILTHAHSDHMGGAGQLRSALDAQVYAPWQAAPWVRAGDETAVSLELAKRAGYYPQDYHLQACPVDVELHEEDTIRVGDLEMRVLETPGHCRGHCSYIVETATRKLLFGGDLVFFNGTIILQNIPDCSIQEYAASVEKLDGLNINALLCGHMTLPLHDGQRHIDMALEAFRGLMVPQEFIMKVAIGGIWHETNSFARDTTDLEAFHAYQLARGAEMLTRYENVRNEIGGMMAGAAQNDLQLAPTMFAGAVPSGIVTRKAFETLAEMLVQDIAAQNDLDGVLLVLHGAMVVEGYSDPETELLQRMRVVVGEKPIVATFDCHANLSAQIIEHATVLIGYNTYPHVDVYERGAQAAKVIAQILRDEIHPAMAFEALPLLSAPQAQGTSEFPMREIMQCRAEIQAVPNVVSASIAVGYPYADAARAGMSVIVTTNNDASLAQTYARELREIMWAHRRDFQVTNVPIGEAVQLAIAGVRAPVILVDVADNIGGGSPGDGTTLLEELLNAGAKNAVVTIADAEAVAQAIEAGIGAELTLRVGGKSDAMHGAPVEVSGRVRLISTGTYVHKGSYMTGTTMRMGRTVVLDCAGIDLVLMERKTMPFDAEQLRSLGIEPEDKHIIVVKSAIAWQAAYGDIARKVIYVDTPGICTSNLPTLPYKNVRRPIFPLDPI